MPPAIRPLREKPTEDRAWPGAERATAPPTTAGDGARQGKRQRNVRRGERPLPLETRIVLGVAGGLLIVLGIAGLFLPFLQGFLFLGLGAAVLSLTSLRIHGWLRRVLGDRWPGAWRRVERFRTRVRWKLRR